MNSRTLLLAATALTFAPLARAEDPNVNDLTAKVLAILNSPTGQAELAKQIQALSAALKANGQGDLNDAVTKLEAQLQNANAATATPAVAPDASADPAAPAPAACQTKTAPAQGLQTGHLQGGTLQSASQGLTSPDDWKRMFSR